MPSIILYIVSGYCFIKVFSFVYTYNNQKDIEKVLISSFIMGYIICQTAKIIPISFGVAIDNVFIILFSILLGFVIAKITSSIKINKFLAFLKIRRTTNPYIWDDLLDPDNIMKAEITINGTKYCGSIHLIEEYTNNPHIILANYTVNGKKPKKSNKKVIVLDTSKATEVVVEYNRYSKMVNEIKFDYNETK